MTSSVFVLASDHGTHSPDAWADMLGQLLFPISPDVANSHLLAAKSTQLAISNALSTHAKVILDRERELLAQDSDARFDAEHDGQEFVSDAIASIFEAVERTPWKDQVHDKEDLLRQELAMHFNSMQNVERMHHSDNNPSDAGDAYKALHHPPVGA